MGRSHLCGLLGTDFEVKRWLSLDPCGLLGITFSYGVHIFALVVIVRQLLSHSLVFATLFYALYVPCAALALISLFMASTTDPGAVPMGARPLVTVTVRRANSASSETASSPPPPNDDATLSADPASSPSSSGLSSPPTTTNDTTSTTRLPRTLQQRRGVRRCHKCGDNYKPPRAHHDSVTGRCIVKFDHYCPWVNNAIGALNHKFFCLFLLYTALTCLLSLLLLLIRFVQCGYVFLGTVPGEESSSSAENIPLQPQLRANSMSGILAAGPSNGGHRILTDTAVTTTTATGPSFVFAECHDFYGNHWLLALLIVSLIFLIFSCSMGLEQLEAIETGRGKIARMKMSIGQSGTEYRRVTTEFNEMFGGHSPHPQLHWFLPLPVKFPRGMQKVVLGYEWDESFDPLPFSEDEKHHHGHDRDVEVSSSSLQPLSSIATTALQPSLELKESSSEYNRDGWMQDVELGAPSIAVAATLKPSPPPLPMREGLDSRTLSEVSLESSASSSGKQRGVVKNRKGNSIV